MKYLQKWITLTTNIKRKKTGSRAIAAGRIFALYVVNLDLIGSTQYGPLGIARSDSSVQSQEWALSISCYGPKPHPHNGKELSEVLLHTVINACLSLLGDKVSKC